jgi:thiamine biosynthesis lipoprotein
MAVRIECLVECEAIVPEAFEDVEREFERLTQVFSRFRPDSELSLLNQAGSAICSTDLLHVVTLALDARRQTGGRFDPTVLDALVSSGYDRTFVELPTDGPAPLPRPCGGEMEIDATTRTIRLAPDTHLDLGGIVKGYAAEETCRLLGTLGPCLVNAGGDIAMLGVPEACAWPIAVDTHGDPLTLGVSRGGVATSGRDFRRWLRGGEEQHHLIDPGTGLPSNSDLLGVTVIASDAVEAEVQAKALFLVGERAAVEEANASGLPCVLRTNDGRIVRAGGLA